LAATASSVGCLLASETTLRLSASRSCRANTSSAPCVRHGTTQDLQECPGISKSAPAADQLLQCHANMPSHAH
jgi:hypothetical protein